MIKKLPIVIGVLVLVGKQSFGGGRYFEDARDAETVRDDGGGGRM